MHHETALSRIRDLDFVHAVLDPRTWIMEIILKIYNVCDSKSTKGIYLFFLFTLVNQWEIFM